MTTDHDALARLGMLPASRHGDYLLLVREARDPVPDGLVDRIIAALRAVLGR